MNSSVLATVSVSSRVAMESPISSEMNEETSDKEMDFVDDYDSEEEKKQRKKRKVRCHGNKSRYPVAHFTDCDTFESCSCSTETNSRSGERETIHMCNL